LRFSLKETQISLSKRLHIHPIRVKMRGDAVVAMDSFDADLTFFDAYEPGSDNCVDRTLRTSSA
jgi:hypothetical protein